jgi:CheY-like chemotaxis protein
VLLDIGLPELDGYEVARRLRAEGTAAHLTKPVAFSDLMLVLEEHGGGRGEGSSTVS